MANTALINYYVRLIQKESYKLDDVPDDVREEVQRKLNGEEEPAVEESTNEEVSEEVVSEDGKLGAKTLHNKHYIVNGDDFTKSGKLSFVYLITEILDNETMPLDEEYPKDIDFELVRIENFMGRFADIPKISVSYDQSVSGLRISINSKPDVYFRAGDEIIRLDLKMTSSNYEDMSMTVYIEAN